ncbi:alpha/beta hydrolase [Bacteroides sp.]
MRKVCFIMTVIVCTSCLAQQNFTIDIWPNGAPNSNQISGEIQKETSQGRIYLTQEAKMYVFLPKYNTTGGMVIICPGGSYHFLSMENEGRRLARWLCEQGIAATVLQYRVPNKHKEVPVSDVRETFAIIKGHAAEWNIDPSKIGIMGFSAGGHLASYHSNTYTPESKPAFTILAYPVTTLFEGISHEKTRQNFLQNVNDAEEVAASSPVQLVGLQTPPTFIMVSCDDELYICSQLYQEALHRNHIPFECHVYPTGGHGWGTKDRFLYKKQWQASLLFWLNSVLNADKKHIDINHTLEN